MAYWSTRAQRIYNHLRSSLPKFLFQLLKPNDDGIRGEIFGAFVRIFDNVQAQIDAWLNQVYVKQSTGIFLDQHAKDQGTTRQAGETDVALVQRLIQIEDVVTKPALLVGIQAIMTAFGAAGSPIIIELRDDTNRVFASPSGYLTSTGFAISYLGRGERLGSSGFGAGFVVILPFGTSNAVRDAVDAYVAQKKAGGIFHRVEVRATP